MTAGARRAAVTAMVVASVLSCLAQEEEEDATRWHVRGAAGFSMNKSAQDSSTDGRKSSTDFGDLAGDIRLLTTGFLFDPKLLTLEGNFFTRRGTNNTGNIDLATSSLGWGVSTEFLPASRAPLSFHYSRTGTDSSAPTWDAKGNSSDLMLGWRVRQRHAPRLNVNFSDFKTGNHLPLFSFDTSLRNRQLQATADDTWRSWNWNAEFNRYSSTSLGSALLNLPQLATSGNIFTARASRRLWDDKAQLSFNGRDEQRDSTLSGQNTATSHALFAGVTLNFQHTRKLSSSYDYSVNRLTQNETLLSRPGTGTIGLLTIPPKLQNQSLLARVQYRVTRDIQLTEDFSHYHFSGLAAGTEGLSSQDQLDSGIAVNHRWRRFEASGGYTLGFRLVGTTFDRQRHTFVNNGWSRVVWGNAKVVRVTGDLRIQQNNLVALIGGYQNLTHYGLEAETHRLGSTRLRLSAFRDNSEYLDLSGHIRQNLTTFYARAEKNWISVGVRHSLGDGATALFPGGLQNQGNLIVVLPIDQLIATPLLDRHNSSNGLDLLLRPKHNLEVILNWNSDNNRFGTGTQDFGRLDVHARYLLGRFTFEGGLGHYSNNTFQSDVRSNNNARIWYFRIARDFRVF